MPRLWETDGLGRGDANSALREEFLDKRALDQVTHDAKAVFSRECGAEDVDPSENIHRRTCHIEYGGLCAKTSRVDDISKLVYKFASMVHKKNPLTRGACLLCRVRVREREIVILTGPVSLKKPIVHPVLHMKSDNGGGIWIQLLTRADFYFWQACQEEPSIA
jgi:hypothetical protein